MKKIIYTRVDGGLSVIDPSPEARLVKAITGISAEVVLALHVNGYGVTPSRETARHVRIVSGLSSFGVKALEDAGIAFQVKYPGESCDVEVIGQVTDAQVVAALQGLDYGVEWAEGDLAYAMRIALELDRIEWVEPIPFGLLDRALRRLEFNCEWAETEQDFAERLAISDVPVTVTDERDGLPDMMLRRDAERGGVTFDETAFQVVDESSVPADREFRGAWTESGGKVVHDLSKAIEIKKAQLRLDREPLMFHLDAEYMKADERGDGVKKAEIAEQKQWLRDITMLADQAVSLEQLRAVKVEA